jgi:hypothetical protein
VICFEQTHRDYAPQIVGESRQVEIMTVPKSDNYKNYVRYAEHCLNVMAGTTDQESRSVQREMAAEWLALADAIPNGPRSKRRKPG